MNAALWWRKEQPPHLTRRFFFDNTDNANDTSAGNNADALNKGSSKQNSSRLPPSLDVLKVSAFQNASVLLATVSSVLALSRNNRVCKNVV